MHESSLVRWLRRLIYSSTLVPLVIFAQYNSPFHFGKVVILRAIVEVMAVLYLVLIWRDATYRPKSHPITWAFLAFTLAFTLTTITSVAPIQSFWGTLERMGGLFTFWHYFVFYLITISVLRTRQDWQTLLDLVVSVGLVSALYGFLQRFSIGFILGSGGRERIFGTMGNAALFAGYQILVGFLAATLSFTHTIGPRGGVPTDSSERGARYIGFGLGGAMLLALLSTPIIWLSGLWVVPIGFASYGLYLLVAGSFAAGRKFYIAVAGLTLVAAAFTAVRGSLLGMVIGALVFVLLYSLVYHSRRAKNFLLVGIALVVVFVFLGALLRETSLIQNSRYLKRVTDFSLSTYTVQTRLWTWKAGFQGWSESPRYVLVGWGPENFNVPFSEHFNPKFYTGPAAETFFDRAHNMFVEVLVTMGLVGEIAYLSIFVVLFIVLTRLIRREGDERIMGIGLTALTVAYIIHNCFIFDTSANFLTFFMILGFATHLSARGPLKNENTAPVPTRSWTFGQKTVAAILSLVTFIFIYSTDVLPTMANFASTRAMVAGWKGSFVTAVNKYREAIDYDVAGKYEYRIKFAQYLLDVSSSADTSKIPDFEKIVLTTIDDLKYNVQDNPRDYLPYLYLSRLYIILGQDDPASPYNVTALEYSAKALEISPTFVRAYYEVGQTYLNMKQYDKAFEAFARAAELNPDIGLSYWYMGMVKSQGASEKKDLAGVKEGLGYIRTAIDKGYALTPSDTQKLVNVYVELGDYNSVVGVYEQLVRQVPDNSQYLASLAVAYTKVGRIQDAIATARAIIKANPKDSSFVTQAQAFLRQLGATP